MAFIPIDAKADIQGSKKGKLTPYQHAQLNVEGITQKNRNKGKNKERKKK